MKVSSSISARGRLLAESGLMALALSACLASAAAAQTTSGRATDVGEVVVTGSRLAPTGFMAPTPVTVVGADRVAALAASSIADVLNQVPQFRATNAPNNQQTTASSIGARILDLRGLGAPRTLVLVDGRRFVPSTNQGTVDINMIPTILVDRTEVVTGGASAAYGSDAVAGVVNFILDSRMTGLRAQVQYGVTERGDDKNGTVSFAGGTSILDGRAHLIGAVEFESDAGLGDCTTRDWCAKELSIVGVSPAGAGGLPANNILTGVHTGTMSPGGLIIAGPLRGIQFSPEGQPIPFVYGSNPGLFMQGGSGAGRNPFLIGYPLRPEVKRATAYGRAEYDVNADTKATFDLSYGRVTGRGRGAQLRDNNGSVTGPILRANPYLPASIATLMDANRLTSLTIGRAGLDIGSTETYSRTETTRAVAALDGVIGRGWTWNAYYQYGQTDYAQRTSNNLIKTRLLEAVDAVRAPSGQIVCRSALTNPGTACRPFNIIGENQYTAESLAYVTGTATQDNAVRQHVVSANAQGNLFSTWAGPVSLAGGAEYRRDSITGDADAIALANGWYSGGGQKVNGSVEVYEGYLETGVPLARDLPLIKSLDLNAAVRRTHYSTSGNVTTWKAGLTYEPIDGLRFRGTRSRDIRAPNIQELFGAGTNTFTTVNDPANAGRQTFIQTPSGGNANLIPEVADTWTTGVVVQPTWGFLRGFRASVDYYSLEVMNSISNIGAQTIVTRCFSGATELCSLIARDGTGAISTVSDILLNVNGLVTRGTDIEVDYRTSLQDYQLSFRGLATHVDDLITIDSAGAIDRAGQTGNRSGTIPGVPEWVFDAMVTVDRGPASMTVHVRHIPEGKYNALNVGPQDAGYAPTLANSINNNRVEGRTYVDLAGAFDVLKRGDQQIAIYGAINNLFDKDPPPSPGPSGATNQIFFDPLGRAFKLGLRLRY